MEYFALQSSPGLIRPAIELQSDLSAVLREGRILGGEVLQTLDGESLLIGIGSHRVPARTRVRMQPGHKFLFQVEQDGETVVLRVLGEGGPAESGLLKALRRVMGQDQPIGELLQRLASLLRSLPESGESALGRGLLADLAAHLFEPGQSGVALGQRLAEGGLGYEARLADVALRSLGPGQLASLAGELKTAFLSGLLEGTAALEPASFGRSLRAALVSLLGGEAELDSAGSRPIRRQLAAVLERALEGMRLGTDRARVAQNLRAAGLPSLPRGLQGLLLRALLGIELAPPPASAAGGAGASTLAADLEVLGGDLKGRLLRALAELPDGAVREALARTLAGLEAEQLLNLARAQSREPLHWSLPVRDGERWVTAHLFFRRAGDEEDGEASGRDEVPHRMTFAVELSHTGPVRADLLVREEALAMRVTASRADVVELLRSEQGELEARLATGGRRVSLSVAQAPEDRVRFDDEARDVRFLREHHLMDTSG